MPLQPRQPIPHRIRTSRSNLIPFLGPPLDARRRRAVLRVMLCFRCGIDGGIGKGVDVPADGVAES